ncbi:MAG: helix-turn-helix transcriptional regulator [Candidatus Hydrothermarchaeales archaeon]
MRLSRVLFIFIIFCFTLSLTYSQEGILEGDTTTQIALNVYLDESGKALMTGYIAKEEMLTRLSFLEKSQYLYLNDTNEIYAVTQELTSKEGGQWRLEMSLDGYFSEYNIVFYLPNGASLNSIDLSEEINYYLKVDNESLVLTTEGFEVTNPKVMIGYTLPIETEIVNEKGTREEGEIFPSILFLTILVLIVVVGVIFIRRSTSGVQKVSISKKEIPPTESMMKVIETLTENERGIVELLLKEGGKLTQSKIRRELGIPKSSLSGMLNSLRRRKIINKREYGRTNLIELSEWFLSEKE